MRHSRRWLVLLPLAAALTACAFQPERTLLDRFFAASRLRDLTALAPLATVVFEPREHGIVTSFEIVRVVSQGSTLKTVIITAPVKLPTGQQVEKNITITIEQREGRWLVTDFRMLLVP